LLSIETGGLIVNTSSYPRRRCTGFTLIEIMIATSISGVLASVAYPSFSDAVQRIRRCEALAATMQLQQVQERWRSGNSRYGTLAELGLPAIAAGNNYLISVTDPSATGYVALAEATGAQGRDRVCRYMKLSVAAGNVSYSSGETADTSNNASVNRKCWNQ
jgi:type IV pilus assembly protein PilE